MNSTELHTEDSLAQTQRQHTIKICDIELPISQYYNNLCIIVLESQISIILIDCYFSQMKLSSLALSIFYWLVIFGTTATILPGEDRNFEDENNVASSKVDHECLENRNLRFNPKDLARNARDLSDFRRILYLINPLCMITPGSY